MESDSDNYEDLYEAQDVVKHDKLLDKVLSLNKTQQLKKPSRTEPTLQISEFNLVKSITGTKGSVQVSELTKSLKDKKSRVKISEGVKKASKNARTLPKPLEKPQADRIRRSVAYEKARLELDRWESVVTSNRVSTNLSFPLDNDVKLEKKEAESFTKMWRVKSKLEEELEKIEPKVEEYHINLEQEKFPLTMKEMIARRKEAAKLRAFLGYKEAKARRQNKVKSKKYHRILKREKIKQKLKEFEQLQKTDPELALKKLEEIEKSRIQERFSLRHKSTGKWARNKQIRAKYDKESRQALAQQLTISRELTQKLKTKENESEEEVDDEEHSQIKIDENNPWVNGVKPDKEVADFVSGYRKYWLEKNKNVQEEEKENHVEEKEEESSVEKKDNTEIQEEEVKGDEQDEDKNISEPLISKKVERIKRKAEKYPEKRKVKKNHKEEKIDNKVEKAPQKKKVGENNKNLNDSKATSNWEVEVVNNETIDHLFDSAENKLYKKMLKNASKLKKNLQKKVPQTKSADSNKEKKKIDLSLPIQSKKPVIDEELEQIPSTNPEDVQKNKELDKLKTLLSSEITTKKTESNVDPNKYMKVKVTNLSTAIPDILTTDENEEDGDQRMIITEAFEDDDVVQEFNREKKDEIDKDRPKNINLALPGWGAWGGKNIKLNKRKKRRFTIKPPPKMPRRDDNKGTLIINEKAQKKIKEHMVSEVPFPFKTVKDFEASMRAPISNTFVPETAYKKLIQPALTTKMGTIIEPMSKDILLNKNN